VRVHANAKTTPEGALSFSVSGYRRRLEASSGGGWSQRTNRRQVARSVPCRGTRWPRRSLVGPADLSDPAAHRKGGHHCQPETSLDDCGRDRRMPQDADLDGVVGVVGFGVRVERVMTDNGSAYVSTVNRIACKTLGIRYIRTRPYRPRTNGRRNDSTTLGPSVWLVTELGVASAHLEEVSLSVVYGK